MAYNLDKECFQRRLQKLYKSWLTKTEDENGFTNMDALVNAVGVDDNVMYSKSVALHVWLLGYELTDTIMVFTEKKAYFLASKKKIDFIKQGESSDPNAIELKFLTRDRSDKDKANFGILIEAIKGSRKGKTLGVFMKDKFPGEFMDSWKSVVSEAKLETMDVSSPFAYLIAPKEDSELATIKKACIVTVDVFTKYLKDQIMEVIDADRKVKHSKLAEGVESAINDKKYISGVDISQVDMCYPAIIQSGGNYSLKFSAGTDKNTLHYGTIICALGARYKSYCSNLIRTLLVNPKQMVQDNYNLLLSCEEEIMKKLVAGSKLCDVYNAGMNFIKKEKPAIVDHLTKNFGFAMGIEFKENSLMIASKTTAIAKKGMVFNLNIGLSNLENKEATSKEGKLW